MLLVALPLSDMLDLAILLNVSDTKVVLKFVWLFHSAYCEKIYRKKAEW